MDVAVARSSSEYGSDDAGELLSKNQYVWQSQSVVTCRFEVLVSGANLKVVARTS